MKWIGAVLLVLLVGPVLATGVQAADKGAIQQQVDEIVTAIDAGGKAEQFMAAAKNEPHYAFILEEGGMVLVHPTLVGKSLKTAAEPVYNELIKATPAGIWVDYIWKEKQKHTYVRKTQSSLIVGSGYSE